MEVCVVARVGDERPEVLVVLKHLLSIADDGRVERDRSDVQPLRPLSAVGVGDRAREAVESEPEAFLP